MRILHFYKTALPQSTGGVEQVIDQLARSTHALGAQVDILSLSKNSEKSPFFCGYTYHCARQNFEFASTGFSFTAISQFMHLGRQADLIHYHFPWPFMDLVHFIARLKKPAVVTYHSDIIRQKKLLMLYKPLRHGFLESVDRIVATSPNYMASSDVLSQFSEKTDVIPIGLDQSTYPKPDAGRMQAWRDRLGPKYFAFVGVLRYYKGLHILIEAAKATGYPVAIAGAGPMEEELKKQVESLGLTNVHFLGFLHEEQKMALLAASLAVVFPSHLRSEAFGISLLEGAMCAKPLISSEIGTGTTFINAHRETGLVVPPGDPAQLGQAMQALWDSPEMANTMGLRAYERYQQFFTARQMGQAYMQLYSDLIRASRPDKKTV